MNRFVVAGLLAIGAGSVANAWQFRSATRLVQVEVVAHQKGSAAAGLAKDDFTLLDNGKPQKIAFFAVHSRAQASGGKPLPPGVVSNRIARDGESLVNATILFVDQKNTPQAVQGFAIQRIQRFLREHKGHQRIAIYTMLRDGSVQVVQELTDNQELLNRAAASLKARDPLMFSVDTTGMSEHAAEGLGSIALMDRGMSTKHALQEIARHLGKAPGRKSLIWVTTSFQLYNLSQGIDFRPDMEEVARQLNDANIALYAVDARGLQSALGGLTGIPAAENAGPQPPGRMMVPVRRGEGNPLELATMNALAGPTGGNVSYNKSNAIEDSIQAVVDDSEVTYTLGFYPEQEADSAWHRLKVAVKARGVRLRYRENYFAARQAEAAQDRQTLEQLLKDHLDATQLEVRVTTTRDGAGAGVLNVRVNVDLQDIDLAHDNGRRTGMLDVSFYTEGTAKVSTRTLKIDIPDDQFAAWLDKGIDAAESIDIGGSHGALRVIAQDRTSGAAGSITIAVR